VLKTARRNTQEAKDRGISVEWIFVEWNPVSNDYLSYELVKFGYTCYIVSPEIHAKKVHYSVADRMTFCQFLAVNVGIRKANGDVILCTHPDDIIGLDVWNFLKQRKIDENVLYRARRYDIDAKWFTESLRKWTLTKGLTTGRDQLMRLAIF